MDHILCVFEKNVFLNTPLIRYSYNAFSYKAISYLITCFIPHITYNKTFRNYVIDLKSTAY